MVITATLKVNFSATEAESTTKPFVIDTVFPTVEIASVSPVFSPNKDGYLDTFEILQKGSEEKEWQAKIVDDKNKFYGNHIIVEDLNKKMYGMALI